MQLSMFDILEPPAPAMPSLLDVMEGNADMWADLKKTPNYHDGTPRRKWDDLCEIAKWSWSRPEKREGLK